MKRKEIFKMFAFVLLTSAFVVSVNFNLNKDNFILPDLALRNLEILAQSEDGGGGCTIRNCPGGCCGHSDIFGNNCSACCPDGKDPTCNSFGCSCWSWE